MLNSRYLLYEAQQAYYYGLHANVALAAITSTPAEVMGMEHRIGFIKEGESVFSYIHLILNLNVDVLQDMTQVHTSDSVIIL